MLTLLLLACAPNDRQIIVQDSFQDPGWWGAGDDGIESPYALGSELSITASDGLRLFRRSLDLSGVDLVSSDEGVLSVLPPPPGDAIDLGNDGLRGWSVRAVGEGSASLELYDGGRFIEGYQVEVLTPDGATLSWGDGEPLDDGALFAIDGQSTWDLRYLSDGEWLAGRGMVSANEVAWVSARDDRDLITVSPTELGEQGLELDLSGTPWPILDIAVLSNEEIDEVALDIPSEGSAEADATLDLIMQGRVDGERVHGVEAEWSVDGALQEDRGDRLSYSFDASEEHRVTARVGDDQASAVIHGSILGIGAAQEPGCSSTGQGGGEGVALLGLLLLLRRRR